MRAFTLFVLIALAGAAVSGEPAATPADAALEQRATAVASELRCLVCQNQTLADSNAPLAVDLRAQIREKMKGGATERMDARIKGMEAMIDALKAAKPATEKLYAVLNDEQK